MPCPFGAYRIRRCKGDLGAVSCNEGLTSFVWVHREEKTEQLMDSKHEVERLEQELQRLRQEVSSFPLLA